MMKKAVAPNQDHWNRDNHRLHGHVITTYHEDADLKNFAYLPTQEFSSADADKPCRVQAHLLAMALKAREIPHELHVYDGGHDWGWWRAALLEHLGAQPVKARWADFGAEFGV